MKRLFIFAGLFVIVLVLSACCLSHSFSPATCTSPEICTKCGEKRGEALGHDWIIHKTDTIECKRCHEIITSSDIKKKAGNGLLDVERALIYKMLDDYLTATNSSGKYIFSEKEAFEKVQELFGVTREYLDNNIWNGHAWDAYRKYS